MDERRARLWFGATAFAVGFGILVQVAVAADAEAGRFQSAWARALNVFCFFTIQSNLVVGASTLLLAIDPKRASTAFDVLRLTGVVAITITGLVYHAVLRNLFDLESWALVADNIVHTIVPIMAVLGWLMFGPRGRTSPRVARLSMIFPVLWLAFTLVRGAIIDWYPYPFIDVAKLGYLKVAVNCVWVAVLYFGVAYGLTVFDRWLARLQTTGDR